MNTWQLVLTVAVAWLAVGLAIGVLIGLRFRRIAEQHHPKPGWRLGDHGSYADWHSTSTHPDHPTHRRWTDR